MNDVAVLISSCDAFADCWPITMECLIRYWKDCPWQIRTMSNWMPWGERPLLVGTDQGWVQNLLNALDHLSEPFVLLFLEDMLLCREVDTFECGVAETLLIDVPMIGAVRLGQGNEKTEDACVGRGAFRFRGSVRYNCITLDSAYRISTSPTLWRVSYLRKILADCGSTAWDFEVTGTQKSRNMPEEIWVQAGETDVNRAFRCYYTGITRGKWNRGCLNWLAEIGIEQPDISRGVIEENEGSPM